MLTRRHLALPLALISLCPAISAAALIDITVSPNQTRYYPGQAMVFSTTVRNLEPNDITLYFAWDQAQYILDNTYLSDPVFDWNETYNVSIPANGSYTWHMRHAWQYHPIDLGPHTIVGRVLHYGDSTPIPFEVVEPVLPTKSFLLDFDEPFAIGSSYHSVEEYWQYGVHLRNAHGFPLFVDTSEANHYLTAIGILADFKMPVYGVTVDVSGATGITVAMIAKDAAGQVIGSVTSDPIPDFREITTPLAFTSDIPIASLEWQPSAPNAGVTIDNLYILIPEPASTLLLPPAAFLLLRRSRRTA